MRFAWKESLDLIVNETIGNEWMDFVELYILNGLEKLGGVIMASHCI
jgi:hypothetical protein